MKKLRQYKEKREALATNKSLEPHPTPNTTIKRTRRIVKTIRKKTIRTISYEVDQGT